MTFTPPPSNLGPLSQPWERFYTAQLLQNATAIERLGGDATNDGVQNNSTLDIMARQINEIYARQTGQVARDDFAQTTNSNGQAITTFSLQVPRPADRRIGWLSLQMAVTTNSPTNPIEVYATFSIDGTVFHRDSRTLPDPNFEPSSWNGQKSFTAYTGFTADSASGGTIDVTVQADRAFNPTGVRVLTYAGIRATYQYGQII